MGAGEDLRCKEFVAVFFAATGGIELCMEIVEKMIASDVRQMIVFIAPPFWPATRVLYHRWHRKVNR